MTLRKCYCYFAILLLLPSMLWCQSKNVSSLDYLQQIKTEINVRHDYPKALSLTHAAAKAYPTNVDFQFLLGRLYLLTKDSIRGERKMEEIIRKVPSYKDAYLTAASIQEAKGNKDKAIGFLNSGLEHFPGDYAMLLKKLNIYTASEDYTDGDKQADILLRRFPKDSGILHLYINYHNEAGGYYLKKGNSDAAAKQFSLATAVAPGNQEALQGSLTAMLQQGNDENSLAFINRMLIQQPGSYELWMKKLGLLQEMRRYPEAIETWQVMQKKFPANGKLGQLGQDLQLEAARYYKKTDPYYEYLSVLEKSPGNKEALDNVISIAISHNMTGEALVWVNKALSYSPGDRELLTKKMGLLESLGKYSEAKEVASQLLRADSSAGVMATYVDLELKRARDFAAEGLTDSAITTYRAVLQVQPGQLQALNSSINILAQEKNYPAALAQVDDAISYYPSDIGFRIKKASILQESGAPEKAAVIFQQLYREYPDNQVVKNGLVDAWLAAASPMMQAMDYDQARQVYEKVQVVDPQNKEVLNNLINIELAQGEAGSQPALEWIGKALAYYPGDQGLLMKKSEALFRIRSYKEALAISDSLHERYPYNTTIKANYMDQLTTAAIDFNKTGDSTASISAWGRLRELRPKDSLALLALINFRQQEEDYRAALALSDTALGFYPDNGSFMMKKAAALESLQQYGEAADIASNLSKLNPENHKYSDYAAYLRSKTFHNQLGLSFLSSHFDSSQAANIATLQYSYLDKKMTITGRLNFAGRSVGTGLQLELESYVYHGTKWYSYGNLAIANKVVFPKWRAGYSLFHSFAKTWEAELGGRIINFDSLQSVSGVASVGHYFGDFWANIRGYASFISARQYTAITLNARQYLNNKTDFFYAVLGYGNSPDDLSRLYDFNQNLKFTTYSIGAGYQKTFNYRNTVSISGTWYNQKIDAGRYRNQYDIYITFFRKF